MSAEQVEKEFAEKFLPAEEEKNLHLVSSRAACVVSSPEVAVLREHIEFLREQLAEKNSWHQLALQKKERECDSLRNFAVRLRVALAEAATVIEMNEIDCKDFIQGCYRLARMGE